MKKMTFAAVALCLANFAFAQDVTPAVETTPAVEASNTKTFKCEDCGKSFEIKKPNFKPGRRGDWQRGEMKGEGKGPRGKMKGEGKGPHAQHAKAEGKGPRGPRMRKEFKPCCKDCMKAKWEARKAKKAASETSTEE